MSGNKAFPVREPYRITSSFSEPRPLSVEPQYRSHAHGAIDIAVPIGTMIYAPEVGDIVAFRALRSDSSQAWKDAAPSIKNGAPFCFTDYFYDTYGAVILLFAYSGRVHVFAHSYFNQVFNSVEFPSTRWRYREQRADARWPMEILHTFDYPQSVDVGDLIGKVGNAGYSTGPHVHWEIHPSWEKRASYAERINPETFEGGL